MMELARTSAMLETIQVNLLMTISCYGTEATDSRHTLIVSDQYPNDGPKNSPQASVWGVIVNARHRLIHVRKL